MVEVLLTTVILVVAVGGLSSAVVGTLRLNEVNEETARAHNAARQMAEAVQGTAFRNVYATFNASGLDDPNGEGTAAGKDFAVAGLPVQAGDPDGFVGEIVFPTVDNVGAAEFLREDVVNANLGMPRDLNGDGLQDALDHSGDYVILPMTVRLAWSGVSGDRVFELHTVLVP